MQNKTRGVVERGIVRISGWAIWAIWAGWGILLFWIAFGELDFSEYPACLGSEEWLGCFFAGTIRGREAWHLEALLGAVLAINLGVLVFRGAYEKAYGRAVVAFVQSHIEGSDLTEVLLEAQLKKLRRKYISDSFDKTLGNYALVSTLVLVGYSVFVAYNPTRDAYDFELSLILFFTLSWFLPFLTIFTPLARPSSSDKECIIKDYHAMLVTNARSGAMQILQGLEKSGKSGDGRTPPKPKKTDPRY